MKDDVVTIERMDLSTGTKRILERAHIYTNHTLSKKTCGEIKAITGLSAKQFLEIKFALFKTGACFLDESLKKCYSKDALENLPLSYKTICDLKHAGIKSIGQLRKYSTTELKALSIVHATSYNEIAKKLNKTKYHLKNQEPNSPAKLSSREFINSSVDILSISSAAAAALKKNGIKKISQLLLFSKEEMMRLPGIGYTRYYDIHYALLSHDYVYVDGKYILESEILNEKDLSAYGHIEDDFDLFDDLDSLLEMDNEYIDEENYSI